MLDSNLSGFDFAADDAEGGDEDDPDANFSDFDIADSIGKALALVKQVFSLF